MSTSLETCPHSGALQELPDGSRWLNNDPDTGSRLRMAGKTGELSRVQAEGCAQHQPGRGIESWVGQAPGALVLKAMRGFAKGSHWKK